MGLFKRMASVFKSEVNSLVDSIEDPVKLAEYSLTEAKEAYIKLKKESAEVVAQSIQMEKKYKGAVAESEKWHSVAVKALKAGNEADAKAALQNEGEAKAKAENLKTAYLESKDAADKVKDALNKLQAKIDSMETRKESIKAKATTARIKERAASIDFGATSDISATFDRMEEKADKMLASAEAVENLNAAENFEEESDKNLLDKYAAGDTDDALAALKAELGMGGEQA